jgi:hypothetical protein
MGLKDYQDYSKDLKKIVDIRDRQKISKKFSATRTLPPPPGL